jgi:hypothetical protein
MSLPRNSLRRRAIAGAAGAVGAALALAACATGSSDTPFAGASHASAPPAHVAAQNDEYGYVGPQAQTVVVPAGVNTAEVRVIGGKGGRTGAPNGGVDGGDGAQVSGLFAVHPGEALKLYVAGYGGDGDVNSNPGPGGWGATGYGGRGGGARGWHPEDGAGGGGASAIEDGSTVIVLAGGGGGGGGAGLDNFVDNGGPGGSSSEFGADSGHDGKGFGHGAGGAGAANGSGAGGGGGTVSTHAGAGGGGGAGHVGGAGGGAGGIGGGGGGGGGAGSSYYSPLFVAPKVVRGTTSDGNGAIFIDWLTRTSPSMVLSASTTQIERGQPAPVFTVRMPADATGVVSFHDMSLPGSGKGIGSEQIVDGVAILRTPTKELVTGANHIWASYAGDRAYPAHDSNKVTVTVTKPRPSMVLSASTTQIEHGQAPPVFTLKMPADATGEVGFYNLSLPGADKGIGVAPIIDGTATLRTPTKALLLGHNDIQASYHGNDAYAAHDSNTVTVTVTKPRPSMVLSASATEILEGQPAPVFTLKMPADATGEIGFYNLSLPGPDKGIGVAQIVDGVAILSAPTRALLNGQNDIQASYLGNDIYAAHDSNTVTVTVSSP